MIRPGSCDTNCISCALRTIGRSHFLQIPQTAPLRLTLMSCDGSCFLLFSLLKQCFYPLCFVLSQASPKDCQLVPVFASLVHFRQTAFQYPLSRCPDSRLSPRRRILPVRYL